MSLLTTGFCLIIAVFQQWHCISGVDIYQVDDSQGLGRRFDGIGGLSGGGVYPAYKVDDSGGMGRMFDGIGGLSAGATSKLLVNYPEEQRNQILDFLFKPNFGASLHILKVEIGGDSESTDGSEASHMHYSWDENYQRGYEWWLMTEAKKRNPDILLYCLPWGFPAWVGNGTRDPYHAPEMTASYVIKFIQGAKTHYNLTFDYVGIWNERSYNTKYVEVLRDSLDAAGLQHVRIVAADGTWEPIAGEMMLLPSLKKAVDIIGVHYPGTEGSKVADMTGKQLWSSEDYSTFNDNVGAGCWARILNQNYVNGLMTSTISWNLIASYYEALPFARDGLMTADNPWSGFYRVESPIWLTAHTTQFTKPGWIYTRHDHGVTFLKQGGSMVTLQSPDKKDFTIVIETMSHNHSLCIRPYLAPYTVSPQNITLKLQGSFATAFALNVWRSQLGFDGKETVLMKNLGPLPVYKGTVTLSLGVDEVVTLTTIKTGSKGEYPDPPPAKPFPLPYMDDFESYKEFSEPYNLAQQIGAFEVITTPAPHKNILRQMMMEYPCAWCNAEDANKTMNVIGNSSWSDIYVEADAMVYPINSTSGIYIAARIDRGGCGSFGAQGVFFFIFPLQKTFEVYGDLARTQKLHVGSINMPQPYDWISMGLLLKDGRAIGTLNNTQLFNITTPVNSAKGFVGLGTADYGLADFDNLKIDTAEAGLQLIKRKVKHVLGTMQDKNSEHGEFGNKNFGADGDIKEIQIGQVEGLDNIEVIEHEVLEESVSVFGNKVDRVIEADTLYFKSLRENFEDEN